MSLLSCLKPDERFQSINQLELINFEVFKENLNSEGQQFPQYVKKRTITSHVNSLTNKHKPGPLKPDEHFQSINSFGVEIKENLNSEGQQVPQYIKTEQ